MDIFVSFATLTIINLTALAGISMAFDRKIKTVYTRFDEFKDTVKREYVQKDVCKIIDSHRATDIGRIEAKLDAIHKMLNEILKANLKGGG